MATQLLRRISSASISARRTTGMRCARAAISSGLSRLIAVETTSTSAPDTLSALWPTWMVMPFSRRRLTLALSEASEPLHGVAEIAQHLGDAAHADAADTDKVNGSDFARQSHGASLCSIMSGSAKRASLDVRASKLVRADDSFKQTWMAGTSPAMTKKTEIWLCGSGESALSYLIPPAREPAPVRDPHDWQ